MFIDELELYVQAGNGGNGCVSFRREKYIEFGGPNGGNGGHGGNVIFRVRPEFNTLLPLRTVRHYKAEKGVNGRGSNMTGANGEDLILEVPLGTIIRERETGTIIGDLTRLDSELIVARGGRGGKGNKHFASSTFRAPKFAQPGEEGEALWIKLELKVMADVGLVGFPNAGKSTLISRISAAKPKVADYPFTTLEPSLGVVNAGGYDTFVVADIPGIIEGAHEGAGLGVRFLKHIERAGILLLLIDPADPERGPLTCYNVLLNELNSFSERLRNKKIYVTLTKADITHDRDDEVTQLKEKLEQEEIPVFQISSVSGHGLDELIRALNEGVKIERELREAEAEIEQPTTEEPTVDQDEPGKAVDPLDEI